MTDIIYTSRNSLRLFNEEESIPAEYIYTSRNSLRLFNLETEKLVLEYLH